MSEVQQQPKNEQRTPMPAERGPRILVACQVGMTGKSTVAANVLHARLGGRFFSVDSVNQDATQYGTEVERVFGDDIHEMRLEIMRANEPVVVDLGASDFTSFLGQMAAANMEGSFDYVVIVTDTSRRGQEEAITTYQTLRGLGMPNGKFRFVLNKAIIGRAIPLQYTVLFAYKRRNPDFPLNENCYLPVHQLFRALHESGQSYQEALNDKTEYEPRIQQAGLDGDDATAIELSLKAFSQMLAASMEEYFDRAYMELRIQPTR
jgi:hypothetical protein